MQDVNLGAEDAALDFVEQHVGRFHFTRNWARVDDKLGAVTRWLKASRDYSAEDPAEVLKIVNRLAKHRARWAR